MSVIYLTLTISTLVAIVFFIIFILNVKRGQYDDTYTPSVRMLFEDEIIGEETSASAGASPEEQKLTKTHPDISSNKTTNKSDT